MRMMLMTGGRDRDAPPLGVRRPGSLVAPLVSVVAHEAPRSVGDSPGDLCALRDGNPRPDPSAPSHAHTDVTADPALCVLSPAEDMEPDLMWKTGPRLDALPQCRPSDTSECAGLPLPQSMQPVGRLRIPTPCRSGAAPPNLCCLQTIVETPRHRCLGSADCFPHDLSGPWLADPARPLLCRSQEHDAVCSRACAVLLGQDPGVGMQTQPHGTVSERPSADLLVGSQHRVAISLCQALAPPCRLMLRRHTSFVGSAICTLDSPYRTYAPWCRAERPWPLLRPS